MNLKNYYARTGIVGGRFSSSGENSGVPATRQIDLSPLAGLLHAVVGRGKSYDNAVKETTASILDDPNALEEIANGIGEFREKTRLAATNTVTQLVSRENEDLTAEHDRVMGMADEQIFMELFTQQVDDALIEQGIDLDEVSGWGPAGVDERARYDLIIREYAGQFIAAQVDAENRNVAIDLTANALSFDLGAVTDSNVSADDFENTVMSIIISQTDKMWGMSNAQTEALEEEAFANYTISAVHNSYKNIDAPKITEIDEFVKKQTKLRIDSNKQAGVVGLVTKDSYYTATRTFLRERGVSEPSILNAINTLDASVEEEINGTLNQLQQIRAAAIDGNIEAIQYLQSVNIGSELIDSVSALARSDERFWRGLGIIDTGAGSDKIDKPTLLFDYKLLQDTGKFAPKFIQTISTNYYTSLGITDFGLINAWVNEDVNQYLTALRSVGNHLSQELSGAFSDAFSELFESTFRELSVDQHSAVTSAFYGILDHPKYNKKLVKLNNKILSSGILTEADATELHNLFIEVVSEEGNPEILFGEIGNPETISKLSPLTVIAGTRSDSIRGSEKDIFTNSPTGAKTATGSTYAGRKITEADYTRSPNGILKANDIVRLREVRTNQITGKEGLEDKVLNEISINHGRYEVPKSYELIRQAEGTQVSDYYIIKTSSPDVMAVIDKLRNEETLTGKDFSVIAEHGIYLDYTNKNADAAPRFQQIVTGALEGKAKTIYPRNIDKGVR